MPAEKTLAPDFTLPDADGKKVRLSDFRGKKVVLFFYPEDDSPGCTIEVCNLRDGHRELAAKNAVVIGVSPDGAASHVAFRTKYGLPYQLLSDVDHSMMKAWGVYGEKNMYGKIVQGVHRHTYVIDEKGMIVKVFKRPDKEHHAQQILPFL